MSDATITAVFTPAPVFKFHQRCYEIPSLLIRKNRPIHDDFLLILWISIFNRVAMHGHFLWHCILLLVISMFFCM